MKILNNFYLKVGIKGLIVLSVVFFYAMCSFYWGNHDWVYLKDKASLSDGFFEARYSMHFFNVLFFEGHILPVFVILLLEVGFVFLGIVSGIYLGLEKKTKEFLLFVLLIGVFPYNLIVSYYLFIAVPLIWWAVFGVSLLFLTEGCFKWWKFVLGVLGYSLLLGSYPPIVALVMVLFCARQAIVYAIKNKDEILAVKKGFWWLGQFVGGCFLFKAILSFISIEDANMYNVRVYGLSDALGNVFGELLASFSNLFLLKSELGNCCAVFLITMLIVSCFLMLKGTKSKLFQLLIILLMFVVSRFMFLVSPSADVASFRGAYWGVLGLVIFGLAVLSLEKKKWIKNCIYAFEVFFLLFFIKTDFEAQKTMNFIFKSEIKYNERLKSRIEENKNYNKNNTFLSLSFGAKSFANHFCKNGCDGYENEILSSVAMSMDLIPLMFFDDDEYKIHTKLGLWSNAIWNVVDYKFVEKKSLLSSKADIDIDKIRYWVYFKAKKWPHKDSLYVDDNVILLLLDGKKIYVEAKHLLNYLEEYY